MDLVAQMVASVAAVRVSVGDRVAAGDTLVVVESMKMEIPVTAPADGTVSLIAVRPSDIVEEGDLLVRLDP